MRIVVLSLVIANLGFWAWVNWVKPAPARPSDYDGPGIVLLRELPPDSPLRAPSDAAPASAAAAASAPANRRCRIVGPFRDPDAAAAAVAGLAAEGLEPAELADREEERDGYWVYIEDIADRSAAQSLLTELEQNGIDDTLLIPNSERGILISLGVFSEIAGAAAMAERVGELGLEATVADNFRERDVIWLRVEAAEDVDLPALLAAAGASDGLEQRDCELASD